MDNKLPRLIDHLKSTGLSNRQAADLLESGKVYYREVPTGDHGREVDVEHLSIRHSAPRLTPGRDLAVIYRDAYLAVVYKPSGLLSVSSAGRRKDANVIQSVNRLCGSAFPVHRLDEGTSGLMMVALTEPCQKGIKALLFDHNIERGYLAIARGLFPASRRTVRSVLIRNRGDGMRGSVSPDDADAPAADEGKEAVTHLRRLEAIGDSASLVEARLETGRTHQVRIHLAESKHPVLGDPLYGGQHVERASPRLALHAYLLALRHPITGKTLRWEVPLADDLEALRRRLMRPKEDSERRPGGTKTQSRKRTKRRR